MTVDEELIAKFLSGEATPDEALALHDWLKTPDNKARFDEMVATWNQVSPSKQMRNANKDEAWRKVRPAKNFALPIGIAATIIALIGFWMFYTDSVIEVVHVAASKSVDTVKLPDQSVVTLNKDAAINYPIEFKKDKREINLERGEAYFSITKDPQKPFVVHASFSEITVVGTEFNVQSHDDVVEVGVNEGVVLVVTPYDSVYVRKGDAVLFKKSAKSTPKDANANTWAYATQKLVFKDTPMEDVINAIEKTYSVTISVSNDNIKKCTLNTTFDRYSVDKILLLISETLNLKLEQNGQVYTLEGDGCP